MSLREDSEFFDQAPPTNQEKPLLDTNGNLLPELREILTEVFENFAVNGQLTEEGATKWVKKCNHWKHDYSVQLAREILNRHSTEGHLNLEEFVRFYQQAAKQHAYHVRKDLKQLGYAQYRPLLGKSLLIPQGKLTDDTRKCLVRIFKKFSKLDSPTDRLTLVGATEWVMKCNTWDRVRASQLATELLRTHGNRQHLTMTREQFLKYYRLASTQHPVHVRKDLEQLGYEVYKLAPMLTEERELTEDMNHVSEDIFYQFADEDNITIQGCYEYVKACLATLDEKTTTECAKFLTSTYGKSEIGVTMEGFKMFIKDASIRDQDGLRQDLFNLGYMGYAP